MSVLRHGGTFLQRSLSKLYSDTKQSYESVTKASRANEDPELIVLHRSFRTQKDRLLAWGLEWSDSSSAPTHDVNIDDSLSRAGFSDVVGTVMSRIQGLLNEAERMQRPQNAASPPPLEKRSSESLSSSVGPDMYRIKTSWTDEEILRLYELLAELTSCIETLCELSSSRRSMSNSTKMAKPSKGSLDLRFEDAKHPGNETALLRSPGFDFGTPSSPRNEDVKGSVAMVYGIVQYDYNAERPDELEAKAGEAIIVIAQSNPEWLMAKPVGRPGGPGLIPVSFVEIRDTTTGQAVPDPHETAPPIRAGFDFGTPSSPQNEDVEQFLIQSNAAIHPLYLDRNALDLASGEVTHALNPPPYEVIAASANTRLIGNLKTSAVSAELRPAVDVDGSSSIPVLVEFTPVLSWKTAAILPPHKRLEDLAKRLHALISHTRTSHTAFMYFVGYFIDLSCSQYAFVYRLPLQAGYQIPRDLGDLFVNPKTLFSILPSDDGIMESPMPSLEDRFRLAYNLILAILQLREQNLIHGNVNSNNIVFMKTAERSPIGRDKLVEDIRHPYLISFGQLSDDGMRPSPEPLSASVYRHPDDRRSTEDKSAWAYDLYSLGLVLLEIGLWTPLNRLWKSKYNQTIFKSRIENVYAKKLASKCGSAYMNVVKRCLAGPESFKRFSTHPSSRPVMRLDKPFSSARQYVYSIAQDVSRCCAIDVYGPSTALDLDLFSTVEDTHRGDNHARDSEMTLVADPSVMDVSVRRSSASVIQEAGIESKDTATTPLPQQPKAAKPVLKKWNQLELPQKCLDDWNTALMPRLSKLLQKALKDSSESCSASLMMVGESVEGAKPTICVTCSSVGRVRGALKRYFDYDRDVWGLVVIRGDVRRSKVPRKKKRRAKKPKASPEPSQKELNPHYQLKPSTGASIGAFRDGEHYPPVSYGGIVMVDGQPYGMTVHHMLDAPSDDDEIEAEEDGDLAQRCAGPWNQALGAHLDDVAYPWSWDANPEISHILEISDDDDDEAFLVESSLVDELYDGDDDDYEDEDGQGDVASAGDIAGVDPDDDDELIVTQPALDDVENGFYPSLEDRNEEHLSFSLGSVFASSGIRRQRCPRSGVKHEIDWALIKMNEDRLEAHNTIPESSPSHSGGTEVDSRSRVLDPSPITTTPTLNKVAKMEDLGGLEVACCGRTSGLRKGRISKAMTLVKMNGRQSFSNSWCVDGGFGIPGDSGAWIFDSDKRQVCGHVLAWSSQNQTAFIAPMEVMFDDIRRTLNAESVVLPDADEAVLRTQAGNSLAASAETEVQRSSSTGLAIDLNRLSLGGDGPKSRASSIPKDVPSAYRRRSSLLRVSQGREAQMV